MDRRDNVVLVSVDIQHISVMRFFNRSKVWAAVLIGMLGCAIPFWTVSRMTHSRLHFKIVENVENAIQAGEEQAFFKLLGEVVYVDWYASKIMSTALLWDLIFTFTGEPGFVFREVSSEVLEISTKSPTLIQSEITVNSYFENDATGRTATSSLKISVSTTKTGSLSQMSKEVVMEFGNTLIKLPPPDSLRERQTMDRLRNAKDSNELQDLLDELNNGE